MKPYINIKFKDARQKKLVICNPDFFFGTWTNIVRCGAKKELPAGGHNHKSKQNSKKPNFSFVPENNIV